MGGRVGSAESLSSRTGTTRNSRTVILPTATRPMPIYPTKTVCLSRLPALVLSCPLHIRECHYTHTRVSLKAASITRLSSRVCATYSQATATVLMQMIRMGGGFVTMHSVAMLARFTAAAGVHCHFHTHACVLVLVIGVHSPAADLFVELVQVG